jgi:hypothetical protein
MIWLYVAILDPVASAVFLPQMGSLDLGIVMGYCQRDSFLSEKI